MKLKREIIIAIALVIIVAIAAFWYWSGRATVVENPTPTASSTTTMPVTSTGSAAPHSLNESGPYYDIIASYPSATPLAKSASASADTSAIATMRDFETSAIANWKTEGNFANLTKNDIQTMGLGPNNKESLKITYKTATGPHTISYIYTIISDTLGAHPNSTYKTFTFDTKTGTALSLSDVFTANADYLNTLSAAAKKSLPAAIAKREGVGAGDISTDMINSGTAATSDNFSSWYIDGADLVIIFPPYQVAAYAAGELELHLPLANIPGVNTNTQTYSHVTDFGTLY